MIKPFLFNNNLIIIWILRQMVIPRRVWKWVILEYYSLSLSETEFQKSFKKWWFQSMSNFIFPVIFLRRSRHFKPSLSFIIDIYSNKLMWPITSSFSVQEWQPPKLISKRIVLQSYDQQFMCPLNPRNFWCKVPRRRNWSWSAQGGVKWINMIPVATLSLSLFCNKSERANLPGDTHLIDQL